MPLPSRNRIPFQSRFSKAMGVLAAWFGMFGAADAHPDTHPGAAIYRKLCVDCHGKNGEGVPDQYDEPLHGNRSVESLAKRIARTMPDDNVGACVGEDAKNVAEYIYEAFYSPAAQARLRPPEIELARLTVAQYRTSVADLVGRFRPVFDQNLRKEQGLKAHYTGLLLEKPEPPPEETKPSAEAQPQVQPKPEVKKKDRPKVQFDRTDSQIAFSFGEGSPAPEKQMDVEQFSVHWEGSIIADETGAYEFLIQSENGVRLWVNDTKNLLIDGGINDGKMREEKKTIYLLGGRAYPVVVEFSKFKEKTGSILLKWKAPHGALETIPGRNFSPVRLRQGMVVSASFPPDDRSLGYERGTAVSKEWDEATTEAAISVAEHVNANLGELAGVKSDAPDRVEKLKDFCRRFVETAFRRPLAEEYKAVIERQFSKAKSPEIAVKRVVLFALKSPRFLYPEFRQDRPLDGYDAAARLALALWDSIPDKRLLDTAAAGKLNTRKEIAAQASQMLRDPRTKAKLTGFFHQWLDFERADNLSKDSKAFPQFDPAVIADLRRSLDLFVEQVVWSENSDYRELLEANYLLLNNRLAKLYGKDVAGEAFQRVDFDPKERAGVVTHPYLLAALSYSKSTSPIHRGVFLSRNIVGMALKPPPNAVAFEDAKFDPSLSMREKVTELTKNEHCMSCHSTINPLGFTLENYDAIGRWRTRDNNKAINPVTDFFADDGATVHLTGARDIAKYAAENASGHRAFIHNLFHHTVKQAVGAYGPDTLEDLRQSFAGSGFNIQKLLVEIATVSSAHGLPVPENKVAQLPPPSAASPVKPVITH